jgi:hypothetical protein
MEQQLHASSGLNLYAETINQVADVMQPYVRDYFMFGFGGAPNGLPTSHCWPLSQTKLTRKELINTYKQAIKTTEMTGPTYFA